MVRRFCIVALCFFSVLPASACEQILLFDADIVVHQDATLTVKEEITVQACEQSIRHGIVREFPTIYADKYGNKHVIDFTLQEVLLNAKPIGYKVESRQNGNYIYIGDPQIYLPEGVYTFTLVYSVNRELGFFDAHDELYWNVTGNGWRLPIKQVQARVALPQGVDIAKIKVDGYTGYSGARGKDLQADVTRSGAVRFKSTRPFARSEGLTVVVGWPKGHVLPPSFQQKAAWFLRDNMHYGFFLLGLFFLVAIFFRIYRNNNKRKGDKPIIPLFYPPKGMSPGLLNYIQQKEFTDTALAAEIVHMAVNGWLTIQSSDNFLWRNSFSLLKKNPPSDGYGGMYGKLWDIFFASKHSFSVDSSQANQLIRARALVEAQYAKQTIGFFESNIKELFLAALVAGLALLGIFFSSQSIPITMVAAAFFIFLSGGVCRWLRSYTEDGFDAKRQIDGFQLFLTVTEKDRMALIGTPPTESPQLYETYLPYAMALGVERQWAQKFEAMFNRLKQSGYVFSPAWYVGSRSHLIFPNSFSSSFSRSLSSSISAAAGVPGSSSGFGGKSGGGGGYSGGGGGGGGGGGW